MKKRIMIVLAMVLLLVPVIFGCGGIHFVNPTSGRGAISQKVVTQAIDQAGKELTFPDLAGKKVYFEVSAITKESRGEEGYIRNYLIEKALQSNAIVVSQEEAADLVVRVLVKAAGTDVWGKGWFWPFWVSMRHRGEAEYHVFVYDPVQKNVIETKDVSSHATYREFTVFFIGPFRSYSWK